MTNPNYAPTTGQDDFDWFKQNGIFMPMINDTGRNQLYKMAIEAAVPGKVVCDIGTGTGLLSILAAKAGATKVYSVEMDPGRAAFATQVIKQVGLDNIIEVINADFLTTDIQADVYISETIGSHVFNENILAIADHALRNGGVFIPGSFDLRLAVYQDHPIFPLVVLDSQAFEFQPDVDIDPTFETIINQQFQNRHPADQTLYQASIVNNLFPMLSKFTDLKLTKLYETEPLRIDLGTNIDPANITLTVPNQELTNNAVAVVLFFTANMYGTVTMPVEQTYWGSPIKVVLPHTRTAGADLRMWYDVDSAVWKLSY